MEHEDGCVSRADRSLLIMLVLGYTHSTAEVSGPSNKTMIISIDCLSRKSCILDCSFVLIVLRTNVKNEIPRRKSQARIPREKLPYD